MGNPRGKLLGRYEIVAEVGRGAMGSVYKARDPKIDRFVAIKTILLHQSVVHERQEFLRRFFIEAKAAGRLLHPGIVAVFDVGEDPETSDPFIVMEYIEGLTLRELLARKGKKLSPDDALRIAEELAEALDYAHAQGVVHRDIKPANILVTKDGQAKIGDFGIAQLDLSHMTLPGRVLGTPAYMSPEQLEGEQVDGRSDLFSLGAILYTALTGYRPFQGNSATTVCFKVANRDPLQATSLAPELPQEMDAMIARALAKDPANRYQTGKEFAEDLRRLRKRTPLSKETIWFSTPPGKRTWLDGKGASEEPAEAVPIENAKPLRAAPKKKASTSRGFDSMFSSWQAQTAIGVPLFVAAIAMSLFAWREMRKQTPAPASIAENVGRGSSAENIQKTASGAPRVSAAPDSDAGPVAQTRAPAHSTAEIDSAAARTSTGTSTGAGTQGATRKTSDASLAKAAKAHSGAAAKSAAQASPKTVANAGTTANADKHASGAADDAAPPVVAAAATTAVADSNVDIRIESRFSDATLKIWIDDRLAYEHPLHDGRKKHLLLLGGAKESVTIPVSAGKHALRIEVRSATEQYDQTKSVDGEFLSGGERILSINFEKHTLEMRVALASE
ncbi:MAG: serine/threonine-protein kinase [Terriglobales bacterium]